MNVRSGREIGRSLERGLERVRRQLDQQVSGIRDLDGRMNDLIARRGDALMELARHYLPDLTTETIQGAFVEVRDALLEVLAQKQRRQRELEDQAAAAERQVEHQDAEFDRVTRLLNVKVADRERLEAIVAERLHGSEEFTQLSQQALVAEQELERNEARVADIQAEAAAKLPSYDRSRLFKYLYEAGFGTSRYQATGITRRIDHWLAKMIDYGSARRGYEFLRVTPELMTLEVGRRRDRFNGLMQQVEAIEDRVSDEVGLTDVMREGQELGAERDRLVEATARAQDELLKRQQELSRLEGRQNEFYEQAVARMKAFLDSLPPARLERESDATPQPEDDALVDEVGLVNDQLDDADRRGAELAAQRQAWDQRLAGMQQALQQFRHAEFDSQRSMFAAKLEADELVDSFIEDRISAEQLWSTLKSHQQFAPAWHEERGPFSGGVSGGDMSYLLLRVLTEVAGAAMRHSASRGVQRRAPVRNRTRQATGRPSFPNRGFTNGRGF